MAIVRAAAGTQAGCFTLPEGLGPGEATASGDPMAALMLRLAALLLVDIPPEERASLGVVLGTTTGCLAADAAFDRSRREAGGRYASPAAFARTLPSTVAAELSVKLKLAGPMLTVCAGDTSTAMAVRRAVSWRRHCLGMRCCLAGGFEQEDDQVRGALLLLDDEGMGSVSVGARPHANLEARSDDSLASLMSWVRAGGRMDLAGITLRAVNGGR